MVSKTESNNDISSNIIDLMLTSFLPVNRTGSVRNIAVLFAMVTKHPIDTVLK